MSSYEFWDELGKIFNAVVAYQEKNLEFNKRFISPWIRLGNVFEKQDRNQEAMIAYKRAIEIDGENPQNWYELGNIHFKMENYAEALDAFHRAIELDPSFGWAHNNLALTLATMGETEQAVALYQAAIELLPDAKDKAVAWNRLGNAYRKLNEYERALEAFHKADELDRENAGFRDSLDEVTEGPTLVAQPTENNPSEATQEVSVSPIELIVADSHTDEEPASPAIPEIQLPEESRAVEGAVPSEPTALRAVNTNQPVPENESTEGNAETPSAQTEVAPMRAPVPEVMAEVKNAAQAEETVTVVVQDSTQTFTETIPIAPLASEAGSALSALASDEAVPAADQKQATEVVTSGEAPLPDPSMPTEPLAEPGAPIELEETQPSPTAQLTEPTESTEAGATLDPAPNSLADQLLEAEPEVLDVAQQVAYEAFLKDTSDPLNSRGTEEDEVEVEAPGSPEPVAKLDETGELQIEMDTKNAHVWNELGNVYFNTSAFDDAIVAYSKAIELDRWFAWPYSNLALAYVQKRRFVEAILLYQRSIELFSTDKDKAISWNRLGNVYRRLNDYENAIAAYQRADALDPDNSTLSLQSRFSLLGNYAMEQKPSYVS